VGDAWAMRALSIIGLIWRRVIRRGGRAVVGQTSPVGLQVVATKPGRRADPVFVLCMGRPGSRLLPFVLDVHPDLACPPDTGWPALCGQLAVLWSLIEGAPLSATRGESPLRVPDVRCRLLDEALDLATSTVQDQA
jgi:hypothetical protein